MTSPSTRARRRFGQWPIWWLIAAWFCANSPQSLTYDVVVWVGSARHFSHQQKLTAEVAFLLAGERAPQLIATVGDAPVKPFSPAVSEEAAVKKITLAAFAKSELLLPAAPMVLRPDGSCPPLASAWPHVPYEPPRARQVS